MRRIASFLVLFALVATGCSIANTSPDEVACAYGGGLWESKTLKGKYDPGSGMKVTGVADSIVYLPSNVRNYIVDRDPGSGDKPTVDFITAPAKDGVLMEYEISSRFRINTDLACKLWEEHGKRFKIDTAAGWQDFLEQNYRPILDRKMLEQSTSYNSEPVWRNLDTDDTPTQTLMQSNIGPELTREINRSLGDSYLCGVSWVPGTEECPPIEILIKSAETADKTLMQKYTNIQAEEAARQQAERENATKLEIIDGENERELANVEARKARELEAANLDVEIAAREAEAAAERAKALTAECVALTEQGVDCALFEAARNGQTQFWVLPEGDSFTPLVNVG